MIFLHGSEQHIGNEVWVASHYVPGSLPASPLPSYSDLLRLGVSGMSCSLL